MSGRETTGLRPLVVTAEGSRDYFWAEHFLVRRVSTRIMIAGGCPVKEAWDWSDHLCVGPKLYREHIQKDSKVESGQEVSTVTGVFVIISSDVIAS